MLPKKALDTTVAETEEMTMGVNCATAKSPRRISTENMAPAMGALKAAAIPAAAPHPTRVCMRLREHLNHWPKVEPMAEPIWTMGPSRPTEPPDAMVMAEATALLTTTRGRITPFFKVMASITSGTPWPLASLEK